ncbi:hypothetical protein JCM11641_000163 [Rhodosporidiobolus odoratus]
MGWSDSIPGLAAITQKASAALPRSTSTFSVGAGIEGKPTGEILEAHAAATGGARKVDGNASWWDDEDGFSPASIVLRILQTFFSFVNLCIYITLAAFQSKWQVGVSFLVGLSLFFNIEGLMHSGVILSTILLADKVRFLQGLERALKQIRVAVIINAFQSTVFLLAAIITTVSANVGGCKDASKDAHADVDGYTDALPTFCRNKRAAAAFFWLTFFSWLGSLTLTVLVFIRIRRHPTSGGFAPPGSHFPADADEAFSRPSYEPGYAPTSTAENPFTNVHAAHSHANMGGGYRPSHDYAEGGERLFDEQGLRGQGYDAAPQRRDPFEDPQEEYGAGGGEGRYGGSVDPYEAIRQSMDVHRPQSQY